MWVSPWRGTGAQVAASGAGGADAGEEGRTRLRTALLQAGARAARLPSRVDCPATWQSSNFIFILQARKLRFREARTWPKVTKFVDGARTGCMICGVQCKVNI